ncbi:NIP3 homolog [Zerene cesonia]|uniref:NIP3 homolog n=1 Tax=Zerene cesonia TaxID=33412 RepID=UPI0018E54CB4|nr:NIP3 homolog [Zerene cesonia]
MILARKSSKSSKAPEVMGTHALVSTCHEQVTRNISLDRTISTRVADVGRWSRSRVVSRYSARDYRPKSPPNSPNLEPSTEDELKGVYINCWRDDSNDWVWEWSSRPDQLPPKDWRFKHPVNARGPPSATSSIEVLEQQLQPAGQQQGHCLSVRRACLFSRGAIAAVLLTNVVSLLLGAGIGVWLSKKGMLPPRLIVLN